MNKLRIHSRRVASALEKGGEDLVVACPRQERAIDCMECMTCAAYEGLQLDGGRGVSYLVCDVPDTQIPASTADRPQVADIMSADVLCVRDDLAVSELKQLLLDENASCAPVVDATRGPIGMISRSDLMREPPPGTVVGEIMTRRVISVPTRATIAQAAALMAYEGVHQLAVVSDDEKILGLVTALAILRWEAQRAATLATPFP